MIDEEECRARIRYAQEQDISNFYMLTLDKVMFATWKAVHLSFSFPSLNDWHLQHSTVIHYSVELHCQPEPHLGQKFGVDLLKCF